MPGVWLHADGPMHATPTVTAHTTVPCMSLHTCLQLFKAKQERGRIQLIAEFDKDNKDGEMMTAIRSPHPAPKVTYSKGF